MEEDYRYLRIGTSIYKVVYYPTANGETVKQIMLWSYSALVHDEGKEFAASIPKFDGYCTVPEHVNLFSSLFRGDFVNS